MKKPRLICLMPLRRRPRSLDDVLEPVLRHGVRREDLGRAALPLSIYLLFTDGQGTWPVEVNLLTLDGARSGRPLPATVTLETPLSLAPVWIDTGIRITRFGYNFITVDLDGEEIARLPFHIYELDGEAAAS